MTVSPAPPAARPCGVHIMRSLGLEPDPWQVEVLEAGHPRLLLNCCRQAGKSTVVAALARELGAVIVPGCSSSPIGKLIRRGLSGLEPMDPFELQSAYTADRFAREHAIPYFGICLGMQLAVIEFEHVRFDEDGAATILILRLQVRCRRRRAPRPGGFTPRNSNGARSSAAFPVLWTSSIRRIINRATLHAGCDAAISRELSGHSMRIVAHRI